MAVTAMTIVSDRRDNQSTVAGTITGVALDAAVSESFTLPAGFGDMYVKALEVELGSFSGAYVAPSPAYDGIRAKVIDAASATIDILGAMRFVLYSGSTGLTAWFDFNNLVLVRQNERFHVHAPVLAGAGVTGTVVCRARGLRLRAP